MQFDSWGIDRRPLRQLFITAVLHSLCSHAAGAIVVQPGATGTLEFPLTIHADSADDGGDAEVTLDLPASLNGQLTVGAITIKESNQPQPVAIPKGQTRTFIVNYSVGSNPPEGTHTATLKVFLSNVRVEGGLESLNTSVTFVIGAPPSLQLDAVEVDPLDPATGERTSDIRYGVSGTATDLASLSSIKLFLVPSDFDFESFDEAAFNTTPAVATFPGPAGFQSPTPSAHFTFSGLLPGNYAVVAKNFAGIISTSAIAFEISVAERTDDSFFGECYDKVAVRGTGSGFVTLPFRPGGLGEPPINYLSPGTVSRPAGTGLESSRVVASIVRDVRGEFQGGFPTTLEGNIFGSPDSGTIELKANAVFPHNPFIDTAVLPDISTAPIGIGSVIFGAAPRLKAEVHKSVDGGSAPAIHRLVADLTQHALHIKHTGVLRDPSDACDSVALGDTLAQVAPEGRRYTLGYPGGADAPHEVCGSVAVINPDANCGQVSGLPEGSAAAAAISFSAPPVAAPILTLEFDPALPQSERAFAVMRTEGPWGLENVTTLVNPSAGEISGRAPASGIYSVLIPTGDDKLPPETRLSTSGLRDSGGLSIVGPAWPPGLESTDRVQAGGALAGVLQTEYRVGESQYRTASTALALGEGVHTLAFRSWDNASNLERTSTGQVHVDATPPTVAFQDVPLYTRNPLPALRAVFSDPLAGVDVSSLSLTLDGTLMSASVVGTGDLGAWQSAPSLSLPLHAFEVVHLNGWLYSLGGHAGAFQTPRVLLSRLVDGAPQAWADTAPLPRILAAHSAAVLGGRIYTVGGTVAGDGALNSVFYTDPDDATGLISSWQTGPSLPSSLGFLDAVGLGVANRRLYAVGGRDGGGSPRNTVNFSPIDAQTGAPGAWSAATSLPVPLAFSDAVEWNGRIYVAGGLVGPAATDATDRILSIGSDSNGQLVGSWRDERVMPNPVYSLEVAVLQGRLYVMGGFDRQNVKQSAVHSAAIAADGTLGPWRAEAPLHRPMGFFGSAATSGALYYAGGDTSTGISADVRWNPLGVGDLSSVLVTAVPAAPLAERTYALAALGADRVANAGSTSRTLTVDFTAPDVTLSAGGRALTQGAAQLVAGAAPQLAAAFSDVTSGIDQASIALLLDGADVTSLAQVAVNGNDALATYTPTTLAPGLHTLEARAADRAGNATTLTAQFLLDPAPPAVALSSPTSGALFGAGPIALHADFADSLSGLATGTLTLTVDGSTLPATISFDAGGPSGWQTAPSLSLALHAFEVVHLNGWLYSLGGHAGAFQTPRVLLSRLIDGVPQGWNDTTALPSILAAHSAAVLGGRIYTLGGSIVGAPALNTVYYADPDDTSGLIANWNTGASLPSSLGFLDAVGLGVANRHLYAVGGRDGGGSPHNTVFFSPVNLQTGAPGAWNQTTALPVPLAFSDAVEWNGRIYVAGGLVGPAATDATDRILSIASDSNGLLVGSWRDERVMPLPVYGLEVAVLQGRLYVMGGFDRQNVKQSAVHSAAIASDGTLGPWRAEAPLHRPMSFFGSAATSGALYYAGGDTSTGISADVRYMKAGGQVLVAHASATAEGITEGGPHVARASGSDLAGNVAVASAAFYVDLTGPETSLIVQGASVTAPGLVLTPIASTFALTARDLPDANNAGVAATYFAVNGAPPQLAPASLPLGTGTSLLEFWSVDALGNVGSTQTLLVTIQAAESVAAAVDGTAGISAPQPVAISTLALAAAPGVFQLAADLQGLSPVFPVYYELTGGTFPPGEPALLSFYIDLNVVPDTSTLRIFTFNGTEWVDEPIANQTFTLLSENFGVFTGELEHTSPYALMRRTLPTDTVPPAVAFAFPRADEPGLCRLAQGPVTVRGSAADENLSAWSLTQASLLLGSGTANAQGMLGIWDAAALSGAFTLTLSAQDSVGNNAAASVAVQAGAPARTLALGGKQVLNKPRGVAAGPNRVYVADTNADRVRVFDAAGVALAVLGDKKGAAKLNKPTGLALDSAGNIFIADANNKRVVKLSPAGVFLAEYGKGALQRPVAVALSAGRLVVADAKAGQLVVFSDAGALLARVDLPQAGGPDEDPEEPRPVALAADAAGNVWAADAKGRRVLRYTPELVLAQTIPGFERPEGVAVSPSGSCLAVSDSKAARISTFDAALSAGLAAFGTHGKIKENRALPAEFFLNKPTQLAFDAQGTLLVADRNNDLIQGFGLPGTPVVVAMGTPGRSGGGTRLAAAEGDSGEVVASARVGRFEGGRVEHPDGAAVEVPAGAIGADLDVAVAKAPDSGDEHRAREAARGSAGLAAASQAREFSPHGLEFREPAVITLPYDPLLAAAPRELKIHYWNGERGAWEALASTVDEGARTVSARVAHFSVYQVLAPVSAIGTLADPDAGFAFRAIYAFPNPAVGGQRPTVHVAVGRADKVTVRFYDVAGTPVHEATLDAPSVVNDESGPHLAYEYAWAGHIPSGIYIYAVTAEKAGHAPIKRVGKLAVVR